MNLEISARGIALTYTLRARVERRFRFALGRFADRIERVRVVLSPETGPSSGRDHNSYRIQVAVHGQLPTVRFEQTDFHIGAMVDWAADRVAHAVARRLDPALAMPQKLERSDPREDRS